MYKLKLSPTILSFIPVLVLIPLIQQLINDFHLGGMDLLNDFLLSAVTPRINNEIIINILQRIGQTLYMAFMSWSLSILWGAIFGVLSSNLICEILKFPNFFRKIIQLLLILGRSIHELVWGIILIQIYGINLSVGIISICIPYTAINAKVICEQIDNSNPKSVEALLQISANGFSSLITLLWKPILFTLRNFGLYRFECALRSTTILGLFGLGGLGTSIFLSFQDLKFNELWAYLWSLALLISCSKVILNPENITKLNAKISSFLILIISCFFFYSVYFILDFFLIEKGSWIYLTKNLLSFTINPNSLLKQTSETIILGVISTGISVGLPPTLLFIFNDKLSLFCLQFLAFLFRLIHPSILILILLMFNEPSISLAAITLGIHNASITLKLLITNLKQLDNAEYDALRYSGCLTRISWLYGLFSKQAKSYLAYCAYRSDIIFRETAVVGVMGSIGLGWQLRESLSSFAWGEVSIILMIYSSIAIMGEIFNAKIKANFI